LVLLIQAGVAAGIWTALRLPPWRLKLATHSPPTHAQQQAGVRHSSHEIAGVAVPLVAFLASNFLPRRAQAASQVAAAAALPGSLLTRVGVIGEGEQDSRVPAFVSRSRIIW
jgi:hypothetical protein